MLGFSFLCALTASSLGAGGAPPVAGQEARPAGRISLTEEDLAPLRLQRCRRRVERANAAIEALAEAYEKTGNDSWQYARSYGACRAQVDSLKEFVEEYATEVEPNLLPMPAAPTGAALDKLAEMVLDEKNRQAEERARREERAREEKASAETAKIEQERIEAQKREADVAQSLLEYQKGRDGKKSEGHKGKAKQSGAEYKEVMEILDGL